MPRDVVALVSADDFVSAVRVYSDRVNDLLRRNGVPALEAIELCETHSLALLDAVVNAPETVVDLAGWWFARAIEVSTHGPLRTGVDAGDEPASMLAGTTGEAQVRAALAALPDGERAAVVLRDCYDLPPTAVGVALRRSTEVAAELTAAGRLHLVAQYDDLRPPDLSGHTGRMTVDTVSLSRLADGTLESPRAAPLRRHAGNCAACENVVETLAKGRRLAAALPIIAMDDDARESLIDRVGVRAAAVLPSHEAVLDAVDQDHDPGPVIPPVLVVVVLALAVALGVGIAMLEHATGSDSPTPVPIISQLASPTPSFPVGLPSVQPPSTSRRASPSSTAIATTGSSAPPTTPTTNRTSQSTVAIGPPRIALSPTRGRPGTTITVTGNGFRPGSLVHLSYARGRSTSTARADETGAFVGQLRAAALLPGPELVEAAAGSRHATAHFDQQL